ncbi:hypothetical protein ACFL6P_05605 [Candidatus Latescibacterota bacterium]
MKLIILSILLMLITNSAVYTEEQYTRVGLAFLGTATLSLSVEHHIGDMSVRMNLGFLWGKVFTPAISVNRYVGSLYTGIGVWNHIDLSNKQWYKNTSHFLNIPVGLDGRFGNGHALGAEVDLNYNMVSKEYLPFPGVYYKYRL